MSNFQMLTRHQAEQVEAQAIKIGKQLADLKKAKGDKKQIAALEKQYATITKDCAALFNKDIKIAGAGMKKVEADLEAALGAASKRVSEARTALKAYRAKKVESLLKPCFGLEKEIVQLEKRGQALMDEFALSWNQYREHNFTVPDTLLTDFKKTRTAIIDRTIIWRTKQQKLAGLIAEAAQLETSATEAAQDFETDSENKIGLAVELRTNVQNLIVQNGKKNNPETIGNAKPTYESWITQPFDRFSVQYDIRKKQYTALTATAQAANQALTSLRRAVDNGKRTFTAQDLQDDKIARVLAEVDKAFTDFEASVKTNLKALPEIAKLLTQADKRMKDKR